MGDLGAPLILLVPPLVALALFWARPSTEGVPLDMEGVRSAASPWLRWVARAPSVLRGGAVCLLAWVAASPLRTVPVPARDGEGVAMVVALDVSESMEERGLGGHRKLDAAVSALERFVVRRDGDAIGLVTFAGEALVLVPPTTSREPLVHALSSLRAGELGDGTAVGTAVGLAANRLRGVEARSKVILLLTDGRSNAGSLDPVTAARAAAGVGQKVYVMEVEDPGKGRTALAAVAEAGGGRHFALSDASGLEDAIREIDAMEPSRLPGAPLTARVPASAGLLWWAGAFLLLERVLRGSRRARIP